MKCLASALMLLASTLPAPGRAQENTAAGTETRARALDVKARTAVLAGESNLAIQLQSQALALSYNPGRILNLGKLYDSKCDLGKAPLKRAS